MENVIIEYIFSLSIFFTFEAVGNLLFKLSKDKFNKVKYRNLNRN